MYFTLIYLLLATQSTDGLTTAATMYIDSQDERSLCMYRGACFTSKPSALATGQTTGFITQAG
jgi:hypothetical protein